MKRRSINTQRREGKGEKNSNNKEAKPYYTNSTQLPVNYVNGLFEALKLQDDLQTRYTGGTVFHIFVGEKRLSVGLVNKKTFQNENYLIRKYAIKWLAKIEFDGLSG